MLSDQEELEKIKQVEEVFQDTDTWKSQEIVPFSDEDKLKFHKAIKTLAQTLLGDTCNLDNEKLVFVLSDRSYPAASFVNRTTSNYSYINISAAMFSFCDNLDQLAFVLAHELGHFEHRKERGLLRPAQKAEEEYADLNAVSKLAHAGLNIEQAYEIAQKLFDNKPSLAGIIDEHMLDQNRVTLIGDVVSMTRQQLLKDGENSPDVVGDVTHAYESALSDLIQNRPHRQTLKDYFASDAFNNLSVDGKIDTFFTILDAFVVHQNGTCDLPEPNKSILGRVAKQLFSEDPPCHLNGQECTCKTRLIAGIYESIFKERTAKEVESKRFFFNNLLSPFIITLADNDNPNKGALLSPIVQKGLKGLRQATGEDAAAFMEKAIAVRNYVCDLVLVHKHLFPLFFDLEYSPNDIGKTFSKDVLMYQHADKIQTGYGDCITTLEDTSGFVTTSKGAIVINKEGIIEAFYENSKDFLTYFIAQQINNYIQTLNDIKAGKNVDPITKLDTLLHAWQLSLPGLFPSENINAKTLGLQTDHIQALGLRFPFNKDISLSLEIRIKDQDIKKHLTPQALAFYEDKEQHPDDDGEYATFIKQELLKQIEIIFQQKDQHQPGDADPAVMFIHFFENYSRPDVSYPHIDMHAERNADFVHEYARLSGKWYHQTDIFKIIEDARLKAYFDDYQTLEGFQPVFDDLFDQMDLHQNVFAAPWHIFTKDERFPLTFDREKAHSLIDQEDPYIVSYLGKTVPSPNKRNQAFCQAVQERFKQDVRQMSPWCNGKQNPTEQDEENYLDGFSVFLMLQSEDSNKVNKNATLYQYLALDMYDKASLRSKTFILPDILDRVSGIEESAEKVRYFKQECWKRFQKDLKNPEIDLSDRIWLFAKLAQNHLFDEDDKNYFEILIGKDGKGGLLKEIEQEASPYCYEPLRKHRIPDPKIRHEVIQKMAEAFVIHNGKGHKPYNDMKATPEQRQDFIDHFVRYLHYETKDMPPDDARELLTKIAEYSLSQAQLSKALAPHQKDINSQDEAVNGVGTGFDVLRYLLDKQILSAKQVSEFLLNSSSSEDLKKISEEMTKSVHEASYRIESYSNPFWRKFNEEEALNYVDRMLSPYCLRKIKTEFDAAPLVGKSVIIDMVTQQGRWEDQFDVVANQLFDDTDELGHIGKRFLYHYIDSRKNSEKSFYLAAIYVAAKNKEVAFNDSDSRWTPAQRSLAVGARLFMENSGPAGIKLAQAMASCSDVPEYLREEMQKAKTHADPPARWELNWDELDELLQQGQIGALLNSASFFRTFDFVKNDGQKEQVVKILRSGAKALADSEFDIYKKTLDKMSQEMPHLTSFRRLVDMAANMVDVEINLDIGEQQLQDAKKLYPKNVVADDIDFTLQIMDWEARGKTWAVMDKAKGKDFKDLEPAYKKTVAKAVFTTELANMLSGQRFDCDRHAGQYKFDDQTNTIGIFDTGSVSVVEPTTKDKKILGKILASTIATLYQSRQSNISSVLSDEIDKGISQYYADEIRQGKPIPPYLSEFQRGLLALNDFYSEIPPQELARCVIQAVNNGKNKLSYQIYQGVMSSIDEKQSTSLIPKLTNAAEQIIQNKNDDVLTPEAQYAQKIGRLVAVTAVENKGDYATITALPDKLKNEKLLFEIFDTPSGQIQFAKGAMKEIMFRLNPANYPPEERRRAGELLYKVIQQGTLYKKLKQSFSVTDLFDEQLADKPDPCTYEKSIQNLVYWVDSMAKGISFDDLKKAVMVGRLLDKEVQNGYSRALKKNPKTGFIRANLEKLNPLNFAPQQTIKKMVKVIMKKFAPHCLDALNKAYQKRRHLPKTGGKEA